MKYLKSIIFSVIVVALTMTPKYLIAKDVNKNSAIEFVGKKIYETGQTLAQKVTFNDSKAPSTLFACKNCHAKNGKGSSEGGVSAPDIRWTRLIRDSRTIVRREQLVGEKRRPYDRNLLSILLTQGIDSENQKISTVMPRYHLTEKEIDSLIAYLKVVDKKQAVAVSDNKVVIGLLLPEVQSQKSMVALQTIRSFFDYLNSQGGIYQRQVETYVVDTASQTDQSACCFMFLDLNVEQKEHIKLKEILDEQLVISIFQSSESSSENTNFQKSESISDMHFSLYSSQEYSRYWLYNYSKKVSRIEKLNSDSTLLSAGIDEYSQDSGFKANLTRFSRNREMVVVEAGELDEFLDVENVSKEFESLPDLYISGPLSKSDIISLNKLSRVTVRVMPPSPRLMTRNGLIQYKKLVSSQRLPQKQLTSQVWTLALANLTTHLLQEAGAKLDKELVLKNLRQLHRFPTEYGPVLSFVGGRRIGAKGALFVPIKLQENDKDSTANWIEFN
ncbi:c-type cytochrome [Aliikangiella sp. G2MR2-5]|uniref:c-type cytochrome n=1 Tax=Aliikangiella sp. G2MR2-5 TaxID=2788943 RepID=UPI0018A907D4|nr:c-type cytochrome [Aliikangiella sp. G2MR2-5]